MSYPAIEARLQLLLQGLTSVFATTDQVTRGDPRILDRGVDCAGILYCGGFREGQVHTPGGVVTTWDVQLVLLQRYKTDWSTHTTLETNRQAVVDHLRKYPSLNSLTNTRVGAITGDEPTDLYQKNNLSGPVWLMTTLTIPVTEIDTVTLLE